MSKNVILSGCSGGGKSTILNALAKRGYQTVEEPGRRIIAQERATGGNALPWVNPRAFLQRAIEMSRQDIASYQNSNGWTFFDRGLIDAASALSALSVPSTSSTYSNELLTTYIGSTQKYFQKVFVTPPWPEIYVTDNDRQHPLAVAIEEYERLLIDYPIAGYEVISIPRKDVESRATFILDQLSD